MKNFPPDPAFSGRPLDQVIRDFETHTAPLNLERVSYPPGAIILEEGIENHRLHVIVQGEVNLNREAKDGRYVLVDTLKPGAFLGMLSFWSRARTFSQSKARTEVTCILMNRSEFEHLVGEHHQASLSLYSLMATSMADRYRNMVLLNMAVTHLSEQLEVDRAQLKETIQDLEQTRTQLIHKERLAMLGQLLAGIAHEINNPGTALKHSAQSLIETIPARFQPGGILAHFTDEKQLLSSGLKTSSQSTAQQRRCLEELESRFPKLPRSFLRKLSPLETETLQSLQPALERAEKTGDLGPAEEKLAFYEIGADLKSVEVSINRISKLIQGLRSYGKPNRDQADFQPLTEMINSTLTVLDHRLKHYQLELNFQQVPADLQIPSDLNQVVSNLLVNACEATPEGGSISLNVREEEGSFISIVVEDSGSGIPPHLLDTIFEPNVTTKSAAGQFGLGLGLAISREIVKRFGGTLEGENRQEAGARFTLRIPRDVRVV